MRCSYPHVQSHHGHPDRSFPRETSQRCRYGICEARHRRSLGWEREVVENRAERQRRLRAYCWTESGVSIKLNLEPLMLSSKQPEDGERPLYLVYDCRPKHGHTQKHLPETFRWGWRRDPGGILVRDNGASLPSSKASSFGCV